MHRNNFLSIFNCELHKSDILILVELYVVYWQVNDMFISPNCQPDSCRSKHILISSYYLNLHANLYSLRTSCHISYDSWVQSTFMNTILWSMCAPPRLNMGYSNWMLADCKCTNCIVLKGWNYQVNWNKQHARNISKTIGVEKVVWK